MRGNAVVTDAQAHVWGADTATRPWPQAGRGLEHRPGPLSADELAGLMDEAGVDRCVLVPPSWEGDRNDLALDAARRYPGRFAVMGRIDLASVTPGDLAAWRQQADSMLGLRLTFMHPEHRQLLTSGAADWVFGAAGDYELPLMIFAPGLEAVLHQIASRFPRARLTLDHLNLDVAARDSEIDRTIDAISPLADLPNVAVKISALPCHVREDYPYPSLYPRIQRAVRLFSARRCFWGSDLSRLPGTYGQWLDAFVQATDVFGQDDQQLMLGRAVTDWLHWTVPPS
jgi:predicted TIM-barrel fold metal-dependent hydrolase